MKSIKIFSILLLMLVGTVALNAQTLSQTYDRLGLTCQYPSDFQALSENIEDGVILHMFVDNLETPKNAMAIMQIEHDAIVRESEYYNEELEEIIQILENDSELLNIEELKKLLEEELGNEGLNYDNINIHNWNLEALNFQDVKWRELNIEEICAEFVSIVLNWGIHSIYNVIYDLVFQSINTGILELLAVEEGINIKVINADYNSIILSLWDGDDLLSITIKKEDNQSISIYATGEVDYQYVEALAVLEKQNDNSIDLSTKVNLIDDINFEASANLCRIDDRTFSLSVEANGLGELIDENLTGVKYAKGVISIKNDKIIAIGWMSEYYGMMNLFEEMYNTIKIDDSTDNENASKLKQLWNTIGSF